MRPSMGKARPRLPSLLRPLLALPWLSERSSAVDGLISSRKYQSAQHTRYVLLQSVTSTVRMSVLYLVVTLSVFLEHVLMPF